MLKILPFLNSFGHLWQVCDVFVYTMKSSNLGHLIFHVYWVQRCRHLSEVANYCTQDGTCKFGKRLIGSKWSSETWLICCFVFRLMFFVCYYLPIAWDFMLVEYLSIHVPLSLHCIYLPTLGTLGVPHGLVFDWCLVADWLSLSLSILTKTWWAEFSSFQSIFVFTNIESFIIKTLHLLARPNTKVDII